MRCTNKLTKPHYFYVHFKAQNLKYSKNKNNDLAKNNYSYIHTHTYVQGNTYAHESVSHRPHKYALQLGNYRFLVHLLHTSLNCFISTFLLALFAQAPDTHIFRVPRIGRKTLGERSFQYIGSEIWNSLPSLCQAFVFTLFFSVKTENPSLLFCILICRFLFVVPTHHK